MLAGNANPLLVSLCDYSGIWSQPFVDAGYRVMRVDIAHPAGVQARGNLHVIGADVMEWWPPERPWGVLAAPSCTCFCRPGARWWGRMDATGQTARDVALFLRCLEICQTAESWWALENPPGRQRRLMSIPEPAWQFQPYEYGHPWVKQTYIWGNAIKPAPTKIVQPEATRMTPNGRWQGRIAFMSSSWKREREKTPEGFARAFFAVNSTVNNPSPDSTPTGSKAE
jgi:hypothetical protein